MTTVLSARQADGSPRRQSQDSPRNTDSPPAVPVGPLGDAEGWCSAFLETNLNELKLQPLTRDAVLAAKVTAELSEARLGEPVLVSGGRRFGGSPRDDELQELAAQPSALYVVFGLGLGDTVRALRRFTQDPIVVFEPDPALLRCVLELGPCDLTNVEIICTIHDLTQIWPAVFSGRKTALLVNTPGYADAFTDAAADLRTALRELVQRSRVNDTTHRLRARDWVADVLQNVELLSHHPGFLALSGQYAGVPAFIVGAGPSLGKNGHLLLQAKEKGLVFAVNSSARALERQGVAPHVLACMESIDLSSLLGNLSFIDDVVRAFTLTSHPKNLRTGKGPLLALWEGMPQLAQPIGQLTDLPGLPVSGSVSTLVFALAQRLGCSPIVLIGQDLAYTNGHAYAPGTPYEASRVSVQADGRTIELAWCDTLKKAHNQAGHKMQESEPLVEAEAWGGSGQVISTIGFSAVRAWLEAASIVLSREPDPPRLVNATEGGARIVGFEEVPLAELLATLPNRSLDMAEMVRLAFELGRRVDPAEIAQWAEAQAASAARARKVARRITRLSRVAEQAAKKGSGAMGHRMARLEQSERELAQCVSDAPLLDAWSFAAIDRLMDRHEGATEASHAEAARGFAFEARLGETIEASAKQLEQELVLLSQRLRNSPPAQ